MSERRRRLSYRLRKLRRRFSFAYLLFIISFVLFLFILVPNLAHRMSLPGENWPLVLELHGSILIMTNGTSQENNLVPAPFVHVEIGGYSTTSASDGSFSLRFISQTSSNIPVVLSRSDTITVQRVSFAQNQFDQAVVLTFR
jgi:hypothetical protein